MWQAISEKEPHSQSTFPQTPIDSESTNRSLLILDDEESILSALRRQLRGEGYDIFNAHSGVEGIKILESHNIGVVVSDISMPEMDGITFLSKVKEMRPDTIRILLTGNYTVENTITAINGLQVFAYLTKPWSNVGLKHTLARAFDHYNLVKENKRLFRLSMIQNQELNRFNADLEKLVKKRTSQLEEAIKEGIQMLALAAEAKDDDTGEHVQRIQNLTKKMCLALGMKKERAEEISFFSIMHDIGKIHVPDKILRKPDKLSPEEWIIMKRHTTAGYKILGTHPFYKTARDIALSHHERWDGSGYPKGLKCEEIPLVARIVTIADVFDALTHSRPYKPAWPLNKALNEMKSMSGKVLDPNILAVFLKIPFREFPSICME